MAANVVRAFVEELLPLWRARRVARESAIARRTAKSAKDALSQLAPTRLQQVAAHRPTIDHRHRTSHL
jgi:hypothetical protein